MVPMFLFFSRAARLRLSRTEPQPARHAPGSGPARTSPLDFTQAHGLLLCHELQLGFSPAAPYYLASQARWRCSLSSSTDRAALRAELVLERAPQTRPALCRGRHGIRPRAVPWKPQLDPLRLCSLWLWTPPYSFLQLDVGLIKFPPALPLCSLWRVEFPRRASPHVLFPACQRALSARSALIPIASSTSPVVVVHRRVVHHRASLPIVKSPAISLRTRPRPS